MLNSPQQHEASLDAFTASGSFLGAPQDTGVASVGCLAAAGPNGAQLLQLQLLQQQPQQLMQLLPTESGQAAASTEKAGASPTLGAATQAAAIPAAAAAITPAAAAVPAAAAAAVPAAAAIPAAAPAATAVAIPAAATATTAAAGTFPGVGVVPPGVLCLPEAFPSWLPSWAAAQADSRENSSSNKRSSSPKISKAKRPSSRAAGNSSSSSSRHASSSVRPTKKHANAVSCSYIPEGVCLQQQPLLQQQLQQQQAMQQQQQQLLLLQGSQASFGLSGLPLLQQQQQLQQQQLQQQYALQEQVLMQQQRQQQLLVPDECLPFACPPFGAPGGTTPASTSYGRSPSLQGGPPLMAHSSGPSGGLPNAVACMLPPAAASPAASAAHSSSHGRSSKSSKTKGSSSNSITKAPLGGAPSCEGGRPLEACGALSSASAAVGLPVPLLPCVTGGPAVGGPRGGPPAVMGAPMGAPPTQLPLGGGAPLGAPHSLAPVGVPSLGGPIPSGSAERDGGAPIEAIARQCYYHPVKGEWRARYLISGKKRMKSFSLRKHPNDVALALAEMFLVYVHRMGVPASDALVKSWHHCVMALSSSAAAAALAGCGSSSSGSTWRLATIAAAAADSSSTSKSCSAGMKQQGSPALPPPPEQEASPFVAEGATVGGGTPMGEAGVGAPHEPDWLELLRACRVHAWVAKGSAAYVPATGVWDFGAEASLASEGSHLQEGAGPPHGAPHFAGEGSAGNDQRPRSPHFAATGALVLLHPQPLQQQQQHDSAAAVADAAVAAGEAPVGTCDFPVASGSITARSSLYGGTPLIGGLEGPLPKMPHQLPPLGGAYQQQGIIPLVGPRGPSGAAGLRKASAAGRKKASAQRGSLSSKKQLLQQQLLQQQQQQQHYQLQQQQRQVSHLVSDYALQCSPQAGLFGGQYMKGKALQQQQHQQQEQQQLLQLLLPLQPAKDFPEGAPTQQALFETMRCLRCGAAAAAAAAAVGANGSCCSCRSRRPSRLSRLRARLSDFSLLCRSVGVRGAAFGMAAAAATAAATAEVAPAAAAPTAGRRAVESLQHQGLLGSCWFAELQQLQQQQQQPQQLAAVATSSLQLLANEGSCKNKTRKCAAAPVVSKGPSDAKGAPLPQGGPPEVNGLLPNPYDTLDQQSATTATLLTWRPALHTPRASCLQPRWACNGSSCCCSDVKGCCCGASATAADTQPASPPLGCVKSEAAAAQQQPLGSLIKEEEDSASNVPDTSGPRACKAAAAPAAAELAAAAADKEGVDSSDDEVTRNSAVPAHSEGSQAAAAPATTAAPAIAAAAAAAAVGEGPTEQTVCGALRHWRFLEARAAATRLQLQAITHATSNKEAAARILHVALHLCRKAAVDAARAAAAAASAAAVSQQQTDCSDAAAGVSSEKRDDSDTQQQQTQVLLLMQQQNEQQQQRGAAVVAARLSAFVDSLKAAASSKPEGLALTKTDVRNVALDVSQRTAAATEASQGDSGSSNSSGSSGSSSSTRKCDVAVGPVRAVLAECDAAELHLQRLQEETDQLLLQQEALVAALAADVGLMAAVTDTVVPPQEAETLRELLTGRRHTMEADSSDALSREGEPVEAAAAPLVQFAASVDAAAAAPAAAEAQSDNEKSQGLEAQLPSSESSLPQQGGRYIARRFPGPPGSSVDPAICAFDFSLQQRISKVQLFVRGPHEVFWCARYGEGDSCVRAFSVGALGFKEAMLRAVRLRLAATGHPLGKGVGDKVVPLQRQQQQQQQPPSLLPWQQQHQQQQQQQHLLPNQLPEQQQLLLQQYHQEQLLQEELPAALQEYAAAAVCRPLQLQQEQQQQQHEQQQQQQLSGWGSPELQLFAGGGACSRESHHAGMPGSSSWSTRPEGPPMRAALVSAPAEGHLEAGLFSSCKHAMTLKSHSPAVEGGPPFDCEEVRDPCFEPSLQCVEYAADAGGSGVACWSSTEPSRLLLRGPSVSPPVGDPLREGATSRRRPPIHSFASSRCVLGAHQNLSSGSIFLRRAAGTSRSEIARCSSRAPRGPRLLQQGP